MSGGEKAGVLDKFLSTHPASDDRAKRLRELIPGMRERVAKERASAAQAGKPVSGEGGEKKVSAPK